MKRPVVIVAMVYVAGLGAGPLLRLPPILVLAVVGLIALSQIVVLTRGRKASDPLLFAAVFLIGALRQGAIDDENRAARALLERLESRLPVHVEGRLASTDRTYATRRTLRLTDCVIHARDGATVRFPTAIQLACTGSAMDAVNETPPSPGDRVVAQGPLKRPPDLSNPDVFNYRAYLENHGIGASLFVRHAEAVTFSPPAGRRSPVASVVAMGERWRRWIEATLDGALEPRPAALVRSILLGQAHLLERDLRHDFTRCGLAHIFAVSGLHVAILLWVLNTFVRLFGLKPVWRVSILILALAVFCAIVGFRASVMRASFMFGVLLAGPMLRNKVEPLTALATAALLILAVNPRALEQAGFQLSFVCMLSIILLKPPLDGWLRLDEEAGTPRRQRAAGFLNQYVLSPLALVLSAQVGLMPFLAHYYHRIPVVGILSNLLAAPLLFFIVATAVVLLAAAAVLPATTWIFAAALNLFGHALVGLLQGWSSLPAVSIIMPSWPIFVSLAYYVFLFGWAVLPREPSPFFERKQRARLLLGLAAAAAWVLWAPAVLRGSTGGLRATFLDVGQGDGCVLELPGGPVILVDGGSRRAGEFVVAPFLESRGIDHVDAVIATHPDADHIGGIPAVFKRLDVTWFVEGPGQSDSQTYTRLAEAANAERARRDRLFAGDWIEAPHNARVLVLHPARGSTFSNRNDQSLVLMVDWGECEILLAGDAERPAEQDMLASGADLRCDVLKVSHHGSANATSQALLDRARPGLAIISCGRDNQYGHPAPAVVERLVSTGATIARTDEDGAVIVRYDKRRLSAETTGRK